MHEFWETLIKGSDCSEDLQMVKVFVKPSSVRSAWHTSLDSVELFRGYNLAKSGYTNLPVIIASNVIAHKRNCWRVWSSYMDSARLSEFMFFLTAGTLGLSAYVIKKCLCCGRGVPGQGGQMHIAPEEFT